MISGRGRHIPDLFFFKAGDVSISIVLIIADYTPRLTKSPKFCDINLSMCCQRDTGHGARSTLFDFIRNG
jgi:hypothetical protein